MGRPCPVLNTRKLILLGRKLRYLIQSPGPGNRSGKARSAAIGPGENQAKPELSLPGPGFRSTRPRGRPPRNSRTPIWVLAFPQLLAGASAPRRIARRMGHEDPPR